MIGKIKGVRRVFPVLGRYDVVAFVDGTKPADLGSTILRVGRLAGVVFTETLMEIDQLDRGDD